MSATRKSDATGFWLTFLVTICLFASVRAGVTSSTNEINLNRNESVFRLTVIHINDMHSRFEQVNSVSNRCSTQDAEAKNCYGGFARVKSASRTAKFEAERAGRNVLFLNAGDTYQGTPYYNLFKWKVVAPFVEKMGFDAMALGNHEFDDGPNGLHPFLQNISAPTLACNLDLSEEPSLNVSNLKSSIMFNFTNFKIGVVGYLTPETMIVAKPEAVKILPEIPEIQKEVDKLRKDGANIVIALGHSGYDKDMQIAEQVEGIDVVIGGHSHSLLHNGSQPSTEPVIGNYPTVVKQKTGKTVLVLQAYAFTKYLGIINLDYSYDGHLLSYEGNTKLLDSSVEEDVEILEELEPWRRVIDKKSRTKLGKTRVFLDAGAEARKGESNLANFVCDAFIDYYLRKTETPDNGWTDTPIALIQAGGLRNSIDVASSGGDVTFVDLITTMPFEDSLCRMTLKGEHLLEAMEWGVRNLRQDSYNLDGAFLHSSGLKVEYDIKNAPGSRVVKLLARCSECLVPEYFPVEVDKEYGVLMNVYLADGGDGFHMFKNNRSSLLLLQDKDTDIVTDYLTRLSPIYPAKEGRITIRYSS